MREAVYHWLPLSQYIRSADLAVAFCVRATSKDGQPLSVRTVPTVAAHWVVSIVVLEDSVRVRQSPRFIAVLPRNVIGDHIDLDDFDLLR